MKKEDVCLLLVKFIPKRIKYWCFIDIFNYCISGKYDKTKASDLRAMDILERYGKD